MSNKFLNWLSQAGLKAAMAENPAVMQASGYTYDKDNNVVYAPSEGSERLAKNLAVLGNTVSTGLGAGLGIVTSGVVPTLVSTATGAAGSYAGGKVGEVLDEKFDTKWMSPTFSVLGGLYGGYKGYQLSKPLVLPYLMRNPQQNGILVTKEFATDAVADLANRLVKNTPVNNSGLPANVGWAPAQTSTWYHHSNTPVTTFKVPFKERWDVVNHSADPNLIWLTKENGTAGMMAERPYHQQFEVTLKKPMVQVGEVPTIPGQKNTSRNAIVKTSRDMGADAVIFDGIADNKLQNQQVVAVFGDKVIPETKWYVEPTTGSTVYQGISLPNPKAKSFVDDVAMLKYYAEHRPKVQRMNFMKEYPTGKYIGEGAESRVFDAGTDVEKILDFDLATRRYLSPDHYVIKTADSPEELLQLIKSVQTSANFRNRHIFSMPVQPAIVRKSDGSYVGMFTQKKLKPLIKDPDAVYEPIGPLEGKIADFMQRSFIQELYPWRGYNIIEGRFNPWTQGPLDGHVQNWATDENGILWGIDIMKRGGQINNRKNPYKQNETRK